MNHYYVFVSQRERLIIMSTDIPLVATIAIHGDVITWNPQYTVHESDYMQLVEIFKNNGNTWPQTGHSYMSVLLHNKMDITEFNIGIVSKCIKFMMDNGYPHHYNATKLSLSTSDDIRDKFQFTFNLLCLYELYDNAEYIDLVNYYFSRWPESLTDVELMRDIIINSADGGSWSSDIKTLHIPTIKLMKKIGFALDYNYYDIVNNLRKRYYYSCTPSMYENFTRLGIRLGIKMSTAQIDNIKYSYKCLPSFPHKIYKLYKTMSIVNKFKGSSVDDIEDYLYNLSEDDARNIDKLIYDTNILKMIRAGRDVEILELLYKTPAEKHFNELINFNDNDVIFNASIDQIYSYYYGNVDHIQRVELLANNNAGFKIIKEYFTDLASIHLYIEPTINNYYIFKQLDKRNVSNYAEWQEYLISHNEQAAGNLDYVLNNEINNENTAVRNNAYFLRNYILGYALF